MVRAPSGQMPRGRPMIARSSAKRKYRPRFESLERKQLLSAGIPAGGVVPVAPVAALVALRPQTGDIRLCGTGKGIIIITS
jgi:hypothetical protein